MTPLQKLINSLSEILGPQGVLTGEAVSTRSAGIWRKDHVAAPVIFRPSTTQEVAAVLRMCNEVSQTVVTHGGLTGLAEGAISSQHDVVLSTERMRTIESVDVVDRTLVVQAGVTLQDAQLAAQSAGLMLPLNLGARGSCTLGGNAATNAGGNQVLRYGMARDSILGLEAVLADGAIISSMNGMLKNNAGYDLKQLFIGTEGTLGVITRLVLRLRPASRSQETALIACRDFTDVTSLLSLLDQSLGGTLTAFELMWREYYALVADAKAPLSAEFPYYVLVEALGSDPESDSERFVAAVAEAGRQGLIADAVVCKSGAEREQLWAIREGVEKTLEQGPALVFDVSVRLSCMETYVKDVRAHLAGEWGEDHRVWIFGHAGDGNLHFVVAAGDGSLGDRERIEHCLYEPLGAIGGSISGEHGIGLEKKNWLGISRSPAEIELMQRLKQALDPNGILNPGRIFDLPESTQESC